MRFHIATYNLRLKGSAFNDLVSDPVTDVLPAQEDLHKIRKVVLMLWLISLQYITQMFQSWITQHLYIWINAWLFCVSAVCVFLSECACWWHPWSCISPAFVMYPCNGVMKIHDESMLTALASLPSSSTWIKWTRQKRKKKQENSFWCLIIFGLDSLAAVWPVYECACMYMCICRCVCRSSASLTRWTTVSRALHYGP